MIDDCSDLEDLDQLDPKEFKDDESDDDDRDMYEILDDEGCLAVWKNKNRKKGMVDQEKKNTKRKKKLLKTKTLMRIKNFLVIFS